MNPRQFALGIISAALLGLVGWVYSTSQRVTAMEVQNTAVSRQLAEIQQDVRELRNALLGPRSTR